MPQASKRLRNEFPGGDSEALEVLEANFIVDRTGLIHRKDVNYMPTGREWDAVDYLFHEWDYAYTDK